MLKRNVHVGTAPSPMAAGFSWSSIDHRCNDAFGGIELMQLVGDLQIAELDHAVAENRVTGNIHERSRRIFYTVAEKLQVDS